MRTTLPCTFTNKGPGWHCLANLTAAGSTALPLQAFEGFNLIVADLARQRMAYLGSRSSSPCEELPPGMHAITNGAIHAHWPKVWLLVIGPLW
jgi:hypothetical protein